MTQVTVEEADSRILFWIDHLGRGGTQKVLCDLVEQFGDLGYLQTVICLNSKTDPRLISRLKAAGAEVVIIGKLRLLSGLGVIQLFHKVQANRCHTALTFLLFADIIGLTISRLAGIPNLISAQRSNNAHYGKVTCMVVRLFLKLASTIVLNSAIYRAEIEKRFLPARANIQVIPNAIREDSRGFQEMSALACDQNRTEFRERMGLGADDYVIGSAGRLSHEKRFDIPIDALLERGLEDIVFMIAGDGSQRTMLEQKKDKLGLSDRVRLIGHVDDMREFYQALDLYVQTSDYEGMPNAVLEAMAQECAVLTSNAGGSRELIENEKHGWLFEPGNLNEFIAQVRKIRRDPALVARKKRSGRHYVLSKYSMDVILSQWINVIDCHKSSDPRSIN